MTKRAVTQAPFAFAVGDNLTLRGEVRAVDDGQRKPIVILCHGFKGFKDWGFFPYVGEELARCGFVAITFNFSCNGVNRVDFDELDKFAINTYSREQADLAALFTRVTSGRLPLASHFDPERIALLGHSRGGGNSILFAAGCPGVRAVVTWNGIADVDIFDETTKAALARDGIAYIRNARTGQLMPIRSVVLDDIRQNRARFDIPRKLAALTIPVLLIQGDRDHPRLVEGFRTLQAAAPHHTFRVIEGADHTFGAVHPFAGPTPHLEEALRLTAGFLRRALA